MHFDEERAELVRQLRARGITDESVLKAIGDVPRHVFVPEIWLSRAYDDCALPIACGQTISQPYTVAFMTQLLTVVPGHKVLEIGTGSGYQAAVLAEMGARVFTIEWHPELLEQARRTLDLLGYNVASKAGDGSVGWSEFAPYDRIIVTAGAPEVPPSLVRQLADGGVLVAPVGTQQVQAMVRLHKRGASVTATRYEGFKFVPLVGKEGWGGRTEHDMGEKEGDSG
ncbi:MAG: protein-L-isoaspartate(D-aspartate) O-methyltransferase [Bacteroidota bacterium]|nr:protein-L-isoaspartate(D-aspartate) O-methyltransferase [Bacteroidota bacterium]